MPESPPNRLLWPPPAETPEVKKEQVKLTASAMNAFSIACVVTGLVGPVITAIPDEDLPLWLQAGLLLIGVLVHLAARTYLRYINGRG